MKLFFKSAEEGTTKKRTLMLLKRKLKVVKNKKITLQGKKNFVPAVSFIILLMFFFSWD